MKNKIIKQIIAMLLITTLALMTFSCTNDEKTNETKDNSIEENSKYTEKKVYFINSYEENYVWSNGVIEGVKSVLDPKGIDVKIHYMNTNTDKTEEHAMSQALIIKSEIESYQPDIIISSDDAAFKYVIMPHFQNASTPVVYCAVNWDSSIYGVPYKNTAGMVEIALVPQLIEHMQTYAKGNRLGYITGDVLTSRKEAENMIKKYNLDMLEKYPKTFEEWKKDFIELQNQVDMIIFYNNAGINDWNETLAIDFMSKNIKEPIGTTLDWMMPYCTIGVTKVSQEQGEWAANAAVQIIDGKKPSDFETAYNKKGNLFLNLKLAEKQGIIFKPSTLKNAMIYEQ